VRCSRQATRLFTATGGTPPLAWSALYWRLCRAHRSVEKFLFDI